MAAGVSTGRRAAASSMAKGSPSSNRLIRAMAAAFSAVSAKSGRTSRARATACGLATAPVLWLQFHALPLLSVPANALAAPAVLPLLVLALAAAAVHPLWAPASAALAWLAGWCAAYLAVCARLVAAVPFAQVRSPPTAAALAAVALLAAAYAWRRRWRAT